MRNNFIPCIRSEKDNLMSGSLADNLEGHASVTAHIPVTYSPLQSFVNLIFLAANQRVMSSILALCILATLLCTAKTPKHEVVLKIMESSSLTTRIQKASAEEHTCHMR